MVDYAWLIPSLLGIISDRSLLGIISDRSLLGIISDRSLLGIISDRSLLGIISDRSLVITRCWTAGWDVRRRLIIGDSVD